MQTDLFKALKKAISAFENIKKLDPDSYYAEWMDEKFQKYVMQLAQQVNIEDDNLVELLNYGWKNYWTSLKTWSTGQAYGTSNGATSPDDEYEFA